MLVKYSGPVAARRFSRKASLSFLFISLTASITSSALILILSARAIAILPGMINGCVFCRVSTGEYRASKDSNQGSTNLWSPWTLFRTGGEMGTPLHFSFSPPYNEADRRVGSFCAFSFTGSAQGEKLYVRKETLEAG